jgi:GT2 family glycosyltransferase
MTINIHCIVITYGLAEDLRKLFQYADATNIYWHIFTHSDIPEVLEEVYKFCAMPGTYTHLYNFRKNRGLSRSWNDGITHAYMGGADVAMIINDDMLPGPGDVQRVAQAAMDHPECGIIKCMGTDLRTGQRTPMEFGLTAITKRGWGVVGAFDENIWPIYWEDIDWSRRLQLSGLPVHIVPETTAIHAGSKTSVTVPGLLEQTNRWYDANLMYYRRKWGAAHTEGERFSTPFNDPTLGIKIEPSERHHPYGVHDRKDVERG